MVPQNGTISGVARWIQSTACAQIYRKGITMFELAGLGGLILLGLCIWAIISILGSSAATGTKVLWVLLVILLPLIGFILWLLFGPRSAAKQI